jgi:hypothetical protein
METTFIPFIPVTTNSNIILDSSLTDADVRMILIAYCLRSEIQQAKSPSEMQSLTENITVSKFSEPRGKQRDHVRKQINRMIKNPEVAKYLSMHVSRIENNKEHKITLWFKDHLPDSLHIHNSDSQPPKTSLLQFHEEVIIQDYLKKIKSYAPDFSEFTPQSILTFCDTTPDQLFPALAYLETQLRTNREKIRNVKGFLIAGFKDGKFVYNVVARKYMPRDIKTKITDNYEYEVNKKVFEDFEKWYCEQNPNCKIYYRVNCTTVYINKITHGGKPYNIATFLKRQDLPFEIVKDFVKQGGEE